MKSRSVKVLAIVVVVLFGVLYALNTANRSPENAGGELLVPELKERLNDLNSVRVTDADGTLTLLREDNAWRVQDKAGYPADTAALRRVLVAIAEARRVEAKTANPSLYDRLGVQHPAEQGGDGVLIEASAPEFGFSLILGDAAQGDYRYARLPAESQSWLIDQNPDLPDGIAGWLRADIIDVDSEEIRSVEIRHTDGETIRLSKDEAQAGTFTVAEIPEGRELSYPTVVNSIAGALGDLRLEDVARISEEDFTPTATSTFVTFDGLEVRVGSREIDEQTWITLEAASTGDGPVGPEGAEATPTEGPDGEQTEDEEQTTDSESSEQETAVRSPAERAADINARTAGWRYQVAGYKADQLTRRWQDILKAQDEE